MTPAELVGEAQTTFLVLCRVGCCFAVLPGVSHARVPRNVRFFLALTLAVMVSPTVSARMIPDHSSAFLAAILGECIVGLLFGLTARLCLAALAFAGAAIASFVGMSNLGVVVDSDEQLPEIATLVATLATVVLLALDFPQLIVVTLIESYETLAIGSIPHPAGSLRALVDTLGLAFVMGLKVSAPFLVYAIIVNLMFGILGKLVPQVPSFFVSLPFILAGGLFLLWCSIDGMISAFRAYVASVLF